MAAKLILLSLLVSLTSLAQANNCSTMAEMAKDVANLRDAGIPISVVEKRLRKDVSNTEELAFGLIVTRLVYKTNGTAEQLRKAILKKCN